uniref:Transposase n=1 Tax=Steinernema glaseri TaxID=37863 RepID=A0A1I7YIB6_9BILA
MRSSERRSMLPVQQTVVADCHRSLALLYHPGEKGREGPPPNKCPKLFSVDRAAVQRRTLCLQEGAAMQNNQVQLIFAAAVDSPPDLEPEFRSVCEAKGRICGAIKTFPERAGRRLGSQAPDIEYSMEFTKTRTWVSDPTSLAPRPATNASSGVDCQNSER